MSSKKHVMLTGLMLALVLLTNRWLSFQEGVEYMHANDTLSYMAIASSAPSFPSGPIPFHHAQRFAIPYTIGMVSKITGVVPERVFLIGALGCVLALVYTVHRIMSVLKLTSIQYLLCVALLVFNPYAIRYYVAVPAMIADQIFMLGLSSMILGLLTGRFWVVLLAGVLAALGRQDALLVVPGVGLWILIENVRDGQKLGMRLIHVLSFIGVILAVYGFTSSVASVFGTENINVEVFGMLHWLGSAPPHLATTLGDYFFRAITPLAMSFAALGAIWVAARSIPRSDRIFWLLVLLAISIASLSILGDPSIIGVNISRLNAHAVVPLVVALGVLLKRTNTLTNIDDAWGFAIGMTIAVGSFHHLYTFIGSTPEGAKHFSLLNLVLSLVLAFIIVLACGLRSGSWLSKSTVSQSRHRKGAT